MSVQRPSSRTAVSDYGSSSRHRPSGSVTSNASQARSDAEGRRDRDTNGSSRNSQAKRPNGVDSAVTRLLVAIKKLLGGLTDWANHQVTDSQISDFYVRFGNDFNAAVIAFDSIGLDMGELKRIPEELRDLLERCLAEDASIENLELYLPSVRKIITRLLEGLRRRQDEYKLRTGSSSESSRPRRSSRSEIAYTDDSTRTEEVSSPSTRSNGSRSSRNGVQVPGDYVRSRKPAEIRRGVSASASDSERNSTSTTRSSGIPIPPIPQTTPSSRAAQLPRSPSDKRTPLSRSAASTPVPTDTETENGRSRSPRTVRQATNGTSSSPPQGGEIKSDAGRVIAPPQMPRYELHDRPMAPSFSVEVTSPTSPSSNPDTTVRPSTPDGPSTPAVESSLAALKQSDALQRRASKRFSTYTMSKMAGPGTGGSASGPSSLRRSVVTGAALTPGDLVALTEVEEGVEDPVTPTPKPRGDLGRKRSMERRQRAPTLDTPPQPPVPSLPSSSDANSVSQTKPMTNGDTFHKIKPDSAEDGDIGSPKQLMIFLQVGRQVKKVTMEPVTSFAQLRVLFMNKFMYNPGQENFPDIYIRDPASGVQYELENVSEVKDKCLLSLNIEPLDQIKQHIDTQIASISQEIKDLKVTVSSSRRISMTPAPISDAGSILASRPTERQFQSIAQRIGKAQARTAMAPLVPQLTGASDGGGATASRIMADLKTQFDEVQNIRRDLGVMRQIYIDFTNSTKESFTALRAQATAVRQVANTKVGGARASINSGKARLDKRSQDVLTEIEDLQDTVESLKDDVLKKQVTPKGDVMKRLRAKIDASTKELQDLKGHLTTIRPAWKKTWEQELQNIVEEQQFLAHQEELIEDLLEDNKALMEVFGHVEKVISIRGSGAVRTKASFKPPLPEEGSGGLTTVMMAIRNAHIDPVSRVEAIERAQKQRQKELASRSDEFQSELNGFVEGKKLKKTGGAEEVERVRQRKDEMAFKAMFGGGGPSSEGAGMSFPSMDGSNGMGSMAGGLPGLSMAPALDFDSDEYSPVSP